MWEGLVGMGSENWIWRREKVEKCGKRRPESRRMGGAPCVQGGIVMKRKMCGVYSVDVLKESC